MASYRLALLGYGNVGRALVRLLRAKEGELLQRYGVTCLITGVASRRLGWLADPAGLDPDRLSPQPERWSASGVTAWLAAAQADLLLEMTSLNAQTGQPAIDYLEAALRHGAHAISANKGPVVHGFRQLSALARTAGRRYLFESAVMDGAPIFSLFRETLPAARLLRFRGILNSTTNFLLTRMEEGASFDEAVAQAQAIGIAEADPGADIDGWDAAVKVAALVTVLMEVPLLPDQVRREGIRGIDPGIVRLARQAGQPYKLVCRAERAREGATASVAPERLPLSDPLAGVAGTSSLVHFETDVLPGLTIIEHNPGPETTAYGLLADLLRAVGAQDSQRDA
jgi:homoserine dehydrogenase